MSDVRGIISLSVAAGIGLAILLNADSAVKIVNSVASNWFGLIRTVSGTSKQQAK